MTPETEHSQGRPLGIPTETPSSLPGILPVGSQVPGTWNVLLLFVLCLLVTLCSQAAHASDGKLVAVVVGIGTYAHLPEELSLHQARSGARHLASIMEDRAGFDEVHLLLDDVATKNTLTSLLFDTLPSRLGPDDTLLFYFTGYGVGGDFDEPYLLTWDVNPGMLQETALGLDEIASHGASLSRIGAFAIITDATHPGLLNGLPLIGPDAKDWPEMTDNFFALSASSRLEIPVQADFSTMLADAMAGAADVSSDGLISAGELHRYLLDEMLQSTGDQIHPAESGNYDLGMVLGNVRTPAGETPSQQSPTLKDLHPPTRHPGRTRRITGASFLGVGVALGATRLAYWLRSRQLYDCAWEGAPPPEGFSSAQECETKYVDIYESPIHGLLLWGAVGFGVAGGTLLVIPSSRGATVAWEAPVPF